MIDEKKPTHTVQVSRLPTNGKVLHPLPPNLTFTAWHSTEPGRARSPSVAGSTARIHAPDQRTSDESTSERPPFCHAGAFVVPLLTSSQRGFERHCYLVQPRSSFSASLPSILASTPQPRP
ncbi:hypothetical protein ISCGN_017965 [Ixodes scapularis]